MARLYVALIADAVASRALAPAARAPLQTDVRAALKDLNRRSRRVLAPRFPAPPAAGARLQTEVRAAMKDLNRRYRRVLVARFAVTLGDELQCLLPSAQPVWEIAHQLRARLPSVDWVVACGRGTITTPLAPTAPEMDGPCFHEARAAMRSEEDTPE